MRTLEQFDILGIAQPAFATWLPLDWHQSKGQEQEARCRKASGLGFTPGWLDIYYYNSS